MSPVVTVALLAAIGVVLGPTLHHLGVRAGARRPFDGAVPRCETCESHRWPLAMRCQDGHPVRGREPWIWLASGVTFAASGVVTQGEWWLLPAYLVVAATSIVLLVTDIDHKLIPNRVLYPATAAAVGLLVAGGLLEGRADRLPPAAMAGAGYFAVLFVVYLVARGGFGFGDVKLAFILGAVTGFQSQRTVLMAVFFTGVIGGVPAIVLLLTRRARSGDEMPYGPPMLAGAWAALVFGEAFGRMIAG
ncbi:MAG TPA: A24 family peptidase [Acidimicrobiia bacterium]|nr:A24 family peptidase [Acidimicrobiia bacterium]